MNVEPMLFWSEAQSERGVELPDGMRLRVKSEREEWGDAQHPFGPGVDVVSYDASGRQRCGVIVFYRDLIRDRWPRWSLTDAGVKLVADGINAAAIDHGAADTSAASAAATANRTPTSHPTASAPTERQGEPPDVADEKGFVANPSDPTAYVLLAEIIREHAPDEWATGKTEADRETNKRKMTVSWLKDHPQIRRTKKKNRQRNYIHLTDWLANLPGMARPAAPQHDPAPQEIEREKRAIRAAKS